jgi:glycosyltransferase involved in cell wall biosynthesis
MTPERNSASHDADGSSADNPLADFDELAYLECNPDVRTAVLQGAVSSGQQHWLEHGRAEGRVFAKSALDASLFPPQWDELRYLRQNPDVAGAVRAGTFSSGYDHWMKHGANEARTGGDTVFQKAPIGAVLSQNTPGVNYFGFHSTAIGLGSVARAYAHLLRELSPNLTAIDVPWDLPAAGTVAEVAAESLYAANIIHLNPDVLPMFLHRYGARVLLNRYNIGCWVWELYSAYPAWHRYSRMFHEIWVPSEFVASAMRPVSAAPVTTVRYVVDGFPAAASTSRDEFGFPHDAFVFLYVFDAASMIERKNPLALIRAFRNAFGDRRDVLLVLKYHHGDNDRHAVELIERLAAAGPNIRTISETLGEERLYSLFQLCDCFVSPHRSEGFGLNIAIAMYYGKPVIATGYSGNLEFTNEENSFLIEYDLVTLSYDVGPYSKGYGWAQPSTDHLTVLMQGVVASPGEARRRAAIGQATIRNRFSQEAVKRDIGSRLWKAGLLGNRAGAEEPAV